jgi:hypothetical protein
VRARARRWGLVRGCRAPSKVASTVSVLMSVKGVAVRASSCDGGNGSHLWKGRGFTIAPVLVKELRSGMKILRREYHIIHVGIGQVDPKLATYLGV